MDLTTRNFDLAFRGFQTVFNDAMAGAPTHALDVAMKVNSGGRDETYGWLGGFPQLREWIGERVIHKLSAHAFTIVNRDFESTVAIDRNDFADDRLGLYTPMFSALGVLTAQHREELVFGLLDRGFDAPCYDGRPFFDAAHPLEHADGTRETFGNVQDPTDPADRGPAWFLLDTSRAVRPLIWQERQPYALTAMADPKDPNVFMSRQHLYGVDARVNAGFGLPQMAFGSRLPLDQANYAAARAAMMGFRNTDGRKLGIRPNVLIVPSALEAEGMLLLNAERDASGATNVWKDTARLIVTPFLGD
jgi:phage major head subunit gpT-like protein